MLNLGSLQLGGPITADKDISVREIFNGPRRRIIEIKLINGAVLAKHRAAEPITVLCLAGRGRFSAGPELTDSTALEPGTFLTLDPDIEHEAIAEPELSLLVTRFKEI